MNHIVVGPGYFPDGEIVILGNFGEKQISDSGYTVIPLPDMGAVEALRMKLALDRLIHLHMCEQEGIAYGMPTIEQWQEALDEAGKAVDFASGETECQTTQ